MSLSNFVIKMGQKKGCDKKELIRVGEEALKGIHGVSELMCNAGGNENIGFPNEALFNIGNLLRGLAEIAEFCRVEIEGEQNRLRRVG